jgi:RNA recognition motif-containing protein
VQFSSAEEARDAMDRMQGSELGEREIRVDVHQPRN